MKKNIKYLLLLGILAFPISSNALTGNFKVTCNDTNLRVGRSTRCTLSGKFSEELSGLNFSISKSDEIGISNVEIKEPYEKSLNDGLNYGLLRSGAVNVEHSIATFDVKLNSDISNPFVTLYNLEAVPAEGYDSYNQDPITVNFTNTKSSDNTLKTITVGGKTINVTSATTYSFTTNNSISKVTINAVANDSGASIIGVGEKTLSVGENKFTITVQAENGLNKEYIIKITRSENNSGSAAIVDNNDNKSNSDSKTTDNNVTNNTSDSTNSKKTASSKTIKNPKTGIYNGISIGILIIIISGISYLFIRKEKYFNK